MRSQRMACISARLYFITGVWPVKKLCDLAQPNPRRMLSAPCCAALSTAPVSSVTYRPGMPILPAARVTSINELRTVAGASACEPAWPWPRASKPTASTAQSTSGVPRICAICSASVASLDRSTVGKPTLRACSRRAGLTSPTMTTAAPSSRADAAAATPTGPDPAPYTEPPGPTPSPTTPGARGGGGEREQVDGGARPHRISGRPADPAAHVDIAIGAAGPRRVDAQAHAGVLLLATAAAPAGDVERHRHDVARRQHLHIAAHFEHLAGDLMAQHQPGRRGGAPAHHMLVRSANVGAQHLQDHAMLGAATRRVDQFGKGDRLHLDLALAQINDTAIRWHFMSPFGWLVGWLVGWCEKNQFFSAAVTAGRPSWPEKVLTPSSHSPSGAGFFFR